MVKFNKSKEKKNTSIEFKEEQVQNNQAPNEPQVTVNEYFGVPKKKKLPIKNFKRIVFFIFSIVILIRAIIFVVDFFSKGEGEVENTASTAPEEIKLAEEEDNSIEDFDVSGVLELEERDKTREYYEYVDKYFDISFNMPDDYFLTEKSHLHLDKLTAEPKEGVSTDKSAKQVSIFNGTVGLLELKSKVFDDITVYMQLNHRKDFEEVEEVTNSSDSYIGKTIHYYSSGDVEPAKGTDSKQTANKPKSVDYHSETDKPQELVQGTEEIEASDGSTITRTVLDLGFGSYSVYTEQEWRKPTRVKQSEYVYIPYYLSIDLPQEFKQVNDYSFNACKGDYILETELEESQDVSKMKTCYSPLGKGYIAPPKAEPKADATEDKKAETGNIFDQIESSMGTVNEEGYIETEDIEPVVEEDEFVVGNFTEATHPDIIEMRQKVENSTYDHNNTKITAKRIDLLKNGAEPYIAYELSIPIEGAVLYTVIVSKDVPEVLYVLQDIENILASIKLGTNYGKINQPE